MNLFRRTTLGVAMLAAVTLVASACSKGSATADGTPTTSSPRPGSPAQVTILSPANGQVIHGSTVKIQIGRAHV